MRGFAVIDFETTGLFPGRDRVVELAIVHLDEGGNVTGKWESLVNPGRDLGAQHVHRIRAADIRNAPTFEAIAGKLLELIRGRVIAAHNASFDRRFLEAELSRLGAPVTIERDAVLCTMHLASKVLDGGRSLADCCAAYDIEIVEAHSAAADAEAAAALLAALLHEVPESSWQPAALASRAIPWPALPPAPARWLARSEVRRKQPHFLSRIVEKLPHQPGTDEELEYYSLLDLALADRYLAEHEKDQLVATANELGLDRETCHRLHRLYFASLAHVAWEDGRLTTEEKFDLQLVARLLDISASDLGEALERPLRTPAAVPVQTSALRLRPGDRVALTGEMRRSREAWIELLQRHGLEPWNSVTKRVSLLAAADPDSLSGKARKAREYGIPIVSESGLEALLRELRASS